MTPGDPGTILVTGGTGQVGRALLALDWPGGIRLHAPPRAELDLADPASVAAAFAAHDYAAIVSSGAWTAVDAAEAAPVAAFVVNAIGPVALAAAATRAGIPIVHLSTDYVFDGTAPGFYAEDARPAPLGIYGASKLAGELAVASAAPRHAIVRTAWVAGAHGGNFVRTMLRVGATDAVMRVVDDQIGCPTGAGDLAAALRAIVLGMIADARAPTGIFHFVNAGEASRYAFAQEVFARAAEYGMPGPDLRRIATADHPTPARRPANSRLATGRIARDWGIRPRPWQDAIAEIVAALVRRPERDA